MDHSVRDQAPDDEWRFTQLHVAVHRIIGRGPRAAVFAGVLIHTLQPVQGLLGLAEADEIAERLRSESLVLVTTNAFNVRLRTGEPLPQEAVAAEQATLGAVRQLAKMREEGRIAGMRPSDSSLSGRYREWMGYRAPRWLSRWAPESIGGLLWLLFWIATALVLIPEALSRYVFA